MENSHPVNLSKSGPPETILSPEDPVAATALDEAIKKPLDERRDAVSEVVANWPHNLEAWACLGELGRDQVESYAAYRVGYHRGLDRLRQSGWKGSGFVLWARNENLGFLRSLEGLAKLSKIIGDLEEAERCYHFLKQLDPAYKN
jgi:hypothetical protein